VYTNSEITNWGHVGLWVLESYSLQGYGPCSNSTLTSALTTNFAEGSVAIGDMDGDGNNEYVFVGNTYYCTSPTYINFSNGIYITNADATRYTNSAKGYDWTTALSGITDPALGGDLTQTVNFGNNANYNPAIGDLDGNGEMEIVFSGYDGKVHAIWLDRTEKGNWPFELSTLDASLAGILGNEPLIVDLDNDGTSEVIVAAFGPSNASPPYWGAWVILDSNGNLLKTIDFPQPYACSYDPSGKCYGFTFNGALGAATIANINSDPDYELLFLTVGNGLTAYSLPNSASAKIWWGTSRGNYQRTGGTTVPNVGPPPGPSTASRLRGPLEDLL